jgi:hypothetical protein
METVTRKKLAEAVCELLVRYIEDGAGEDGAEPYEQLINRYLLETGEAGDFSDYYAARTRQSKGALKKFSKQFAAEYFSEAKD